jgi:hypothetical protein
MTVYLSGIGANLLIAAVAVLLRAAAGPDTPAGRICAAVVVLTLLFLPPQLLVFMRTDLYFVMQDLTGSRNLYADGAAYLRYWGRRIRRGLASSVNPLLALPRHEQAAVRSYAIVLSVGTAVCLAVAITVTLPFTVLLLAHVWTGLRGGNGVAGCVDALISLAQVGGYWALWCLAWWRRHGNRVAGLLRRLTTIAGRG